MPFDDFVCIQAQGQNSVACVQPNLESLLDSKSLEQTWSFLDIPSSTSTVEDDPSQSKTAVQMQQAQCKNLYRELKLVKQVGEGAVFQVGLYSHEDGREFAVKHARLGAKRRDGGNNPAGGIFSAMREIEVNFHDAVRRHQNIVSIMGWDWSERRAPVIITEYAAYGTVRDFLQAQAPNERRADLKRNLALDLASGLSALHASDIAHGDIKLENTLIFPHSQRSWCAKVSDFSHAVFGISTRRKSTYPGSGLYNAPEIRRREATIKSDLLPLCETFSFGLLVWEILKDGQCFFESGWHNRIKSSITAIPSMDLSKIEFLGQLQPNTLLDWAMAFLGTCNSLTRYERPLFGLIFEHTLKDHGVQRSDMSTIASMLDLEDRATIYYPSTNSSVHNVAIWNFCPWCHNIPWTTQIQTLHEFERLVDDYVQPSHAEWYLLLSRCYAEGFGVKIDYSKMVYYLQKAAKHESVEAKFMLLSIEEHFPNLVPPSTKQKTRRGSITIDGTAIFEDPVTAAIQKIKRDSRAAIPHLRYITMIQLWNGRNSFHIRQKPFNCFGNTYFWANSSDIWRFLGDATNAQFMPWYVSITYESLDSTLQTEGFFDACASIGASSWWTTAMNYALDVQSMSKEDQESVLHNSLISAIQNGQTEFANNILAPLTSQDKTDLAGFSSRVSRPKSKTPLHVLPFAQGNMDDIKSLVTNLITLGFHHLANQSIHTRTWLQPLGIEIHGAPLHIAVRLRSLPAVKILIGMGADPLEKSPTDEKSPFELAICLNLFEIVEHMMASNEIPKEKLMGCITSVGTTSSKGVFEIWLLHPAVRAWPDTLERALNATMQSIQQKYGIFWDAIGAQALHRSLGSGWKSNTKFAILWKYLVVDAGLAAYPQDWIRVALDLIEQIISDDPHNRQLLQFMFIQDVPNINWTKFLDEYRYDSESGPETDSLIFRWAKQGMLYNLWDLKAHQATIWNQLLRTPDFTGALPIDAAMSSGCLRTFEILSEPYPVEERLKRAIDASAANVVTHIIRSENGTIFSNGISTNNETLGAPMVPCGRTALHHAAATSNASMIQHLMSLTIPWTTNHIQYIITKTNSTMRSHNIDLLVFKWDPVFTMRDLNDSNRTALDISADQDDRLCVEALLVHDNRHSETTDNSRSLLSVVVRSGQVNTAKTLLQHGHSPYCHFPKDFLRNDVMKKNFLEPQPPKWNFIFQATFHTVRGELQLGILERFLALCKDSDLPMIGNELSSHFWKNDRLWNGWLPIHYAVYCGRIGVIRAFLATEIWMPSEQSISVVVSDLNRKTLEWSSAFQYELLFAKNEPATSAPIYEALQGKIKGSRTMKKITTIAKSIGSNSGSIHPDQAIQHNPSLEDFRNLDDSEYHSISRYRYYELWKSPSDSPMVTVLSDSQVHNLIWGGKSCYEMARDLLVWNDFIRIPHVDGKYEVTSCPLQLRESVVKELLEWKQKRSLLRLIESEVGVIDIEKNVRALLSEAGDITRIY